MNRIYGSSEFIHEPKVGDLKLEVISQWDFKTNPVCFDTIYKGEPNEITIAYAVTRTTRIGENTLKYEYVTRLDPDTATELKKLGYRLATTN